MKIILRRESWSIGIPADSTIESASHFELMRIQAGDGRMSRKAGWEYLPRPEQWGQQGWTFRFHHECLNKVRELESNSNQVQFSFYFNDAHF